jgi:hypothetical protein
MLKRMSVMTCRVSACCCILILIAGCSETQGRWENSKLPQEAWAQDEANCRVWASQRVTRELGTFEERWTGRDDPTSSLVMSLEWQHADRREREFLESCMTERGYLRVSTKENEEWERPMGVV